MCSSPHPYFSIYFDRPVLYKCASLEKVTSTLISEFLHARKVSPLCSFLRRSMIVYQQKYISSVYSCPT